MNEYLQKAGKFKRISTAIFGVFLILTIEKDLKDVLSRLKIQHDINNIPN